MNREAIDRLILLGESGELSPRQRRQLDKALASDPAVARRREAMGRLQAVARAALAAQAEADAAPAVPVRQWAARETAGGRGTARRIRFELPIPRLAAAAALFLTCGLGGWFLARPAAPGGDTVVQLQTLVAVVSELGFSAAHGTGAAEQDRIRELADHLLQMEGFARESLSEESSLWQEPAPTTFQRRSTAAYPQERYG